MEIPAIPWPWAPESSRVIQGHGWHPLISSWHHRSDDRHGFGLLQVQTLRFGLHGLGNRMVPRPYTLVDSDESREEKGAGEMKRGTKSFVFTLGSITTSNNKLVARCLTGSNKLLVVRHLAASFLFLVVMPGDTSSFVFGPFRELPLIKEIQPPPGLQGFMKSRSGTADPMINS